MESAGKESKKMSGKNGGDRACEEEKWIKQGNRVNINMLMRFSKL